MFAFVTSHKKVFLFTFIESDPEIKAMFDASRCIFTLKLLVSRYEH